MDIRLIAADVDGTILPRGGAFSEATRLAARRCRERGIPFVLDSGRWVGSLEGVMRDLGVEDQYAIAAGGGAVIAPDGEPIMEWTMRQADVESVYAVMRRFDVAINSYVRGGLYQLNTRAVSRMPRTYFGQRDDRVVHDDIAAFERDGLRHVYKLEAISENLALIADLRRALARETVSRISGAFRNNTEVASPGMGKGVALRWLAGHLGIAPDQCMAFGDNANDLDMLSAVGWPVAVGNAIEAVKSRARLIAPADVDDGVARVIFERVLGEEMP